MDNNNDDNTEDEMFLEYGDIIYIQATTNQEIHEKTFFIK